MNRFAASLVCAAMLACCGHLARAQAPESPRALEEEPRSFGRIHPGYSYFNKPGADLELHDRDVAACMEQVATLNLSVRSLQGGLLPALWAAAAGASALDQSFVVNIEHCMVVRGWRVAQLDLVEGAALAAGDSSVLRARLRALVGATAPGGIVRGGFGNELASGEIGLARPRDTEGKSLSILALLGREKPPESGNRLAIPTRPAKQARLYKTLKTVDEYNPQKGYVIVHQKKSIRDALFLDTVDDTPEEKAGLIFVAGRPTARAITPDVSQSYLIEVPPGGYVLGGYRAIVVGGPLSGGGGVEVAVSTCLGAPSFVVKPGEIIDVGLFSASLYSHGVYERGPKFLREESGTLSRQWLASRPALVKALRAPDWTNGEVRTCAGSYAYAMEIEGAPFKEGYSWGSKALRSIEPSQVAAKEAEPAVAVPNDGLSMP